MRPVAALYVDVQRGPYPPADAWGGYTVAIVQRSFGHVADKATWLYVVGCAPNDLPIPTTCYATGAPVPVENMAKSKRHLTPLALAEWLVEIARRSKA